MGNEQGMCDWDCNPDSMWPDWMSQIPDCRSLSELSIPGTHNTMAFVGGSLVECQKWPLSEQYKAGIRFVDIRCRHFNDSLCIHHGLVYQNITLDGVLNKTIEFLKSHPTEVILMRIKEEYNAENNTRNFADEVSRTLDRHDISNFWKLAKIPTIGEARGKILVLNQSFQGAVGIDYGILDISDDYEVPTVFHVPQKWSSVENHLNKARWGLSGRMFLTFTSGSSAGAYPNAVAEKINPQLYHCLERFNGKIRWGIIAMDFPASALVQKIIQSNM